MFKVRYQFISVVALLLAGIGSAQALEAEVVGGDRPDYFYQQEPPPETLRNSCSEIFGNILAGRGEDVGGVVRSLKSVNVDYLLDDYDNALSSDRRKKTFLDIETLREEVAADRRGTYCRIELAIYMREHEEFSGPVYDSLLDETFGKLEDTYASAQESLGAEDYERAAFAFKLIAPYRDAYEKGLQSVANIEDLAEKDTLAAAEVTEQHIQQAAPVFVSGPISRALAAEYEEVPVPVEDGPIARAARPGPLSTAAMLLDDSGASE